MFRATIEQVTLRQDELLREAELRRRTAKVRRLDVRPSRFTRVLGLRAAFAS